MNQQQNVNSHLRVAHPLMVPMQPAMMLPAEFERTLEKFQLPQYLAKRAMDTRREVFNYGMFNVFDSFATVMFIQTCIRFNGCSAGC